MKMKALTICEPYASYIAAGRKRVENRTWETKYRGLLAIHAGKSRKWLETEDEADYAGLPLQFGAIIAVAVLEDCVEYEGAGPHRKYPWFEFHRHAEGPWCWVLSNVRRIEPVSYSGSQGLWEFTQAESPREAELLNCIRAIGRAVGCAHTEDADGRARLVRCVEERMAEVVHSPPANGGGE